MEKSKIPTAEDILDKYEPEFFQGAEYSSSGYQYSDVIEAMIEFAKLHVKAALEVAAEKAELGYADGRYMLPEYAEEPFNAVVDDLGNAHYIDRHLILNAYPDENIK